MNGPGEEIVAERVIRPAHGLVRVDLGELWRFRELFLFLAWRDILVRYKQTYLGVAWAVLQPLLTMLVFTVVFGRLAKFESNGVPYELITLAAILPWQFFSNALSESSNSLVVSARMISKVYFPRLLVPSSAVLSGLLDLGIAGLLCAGMMVWFGAPFRVEILYLPLFLLGTLASAMAVGIWMSALNVKYRDVKYIVPFFTRMGLYVSPVGFLSSVVPEKWRLLYSLNPMVGMIDGFRWCLLGPAFEPYWPGVWLSGALAAVVLASGLLYFKATERTFADVI
jgi:lipopolysaccharide transport system permease protein